MNAATSLEHRIEASVAIVSEPTTMCATRCEAKSAPMIVVRRSELCDVASLAAIHAESLPNDFLVRLGRRFLASVFYPVLLASPRSTVYVATLEDQLVGVLVTRMGVDGFFGECLRSKPFRFAWEMMRAAAASPSLWLRVPGVVRQLRGWSGDEEAGSADLFLLAVASRARRCGAARCLIERSAAQLAAAGVGAYRVWLHGENKVADLAYERCGFSRVRTVNFGGCVWVQRRRSLIG